MFHFRSRESSIPTALGIRPVGLVRNSRAVLILVRKQCETRRNRSRNRCSCPVTSATNWEEVGQTGLRLTGYLINRTTIALDHNQAMYQQALCEHHTLAQGVSSCQ